METYTLRFMFAGSRRSKDQRTQRHMIRVADNSYRSIWLLVQKLRGIQGFFVGTVRRAVDPQDILPVMSRVRSS